MKFFAILFSIFLFLFFIPPTVAEAHILQVDGSVGAVLHVSPDDDPMAGVPTDFFFEFKDKEGTFAPKNCSCSVAVLENGKEIYTQKLFRDAASPSLEHASFQYTFPGKNMYSLRLTGASIDNSFRPFTLNWDIRVAKDAQNAVTKSESNWFTDSGVYILGFVIFIAVLLLAKKKGGGK